MKNTDAQENKIGIYTLTGLTVGPILGSGILILPPIVFMNINDWSIIAWSAIILVGFLFAYLFGHLSILYPGDGGVTNAVEKTFGKYIKILTSYYLIIGVIFGAVAVLTTAATYIAALGFAAQNVIAFSLLLVCFLLLLKRITFMGNVVLILSIISSLVLLTGSIITLSAYHTTFTIKSAFHPAEFGQSLLLLVWTILGWEIIGNYSALVKNPTRTIFNSVILSAILIAIIDLVVVSAIQWSNIHSFWKGNITITTIVYPLFREYSDIIIAILTLFLCCSTYLLFVGGITRLISNLSEEKVFPFFLSKRNKNDIPTFSVIAIVLLHLIVLLYVNSGILTVEKIIKLSNGFFIMNVLIGILTGIIIIKNRFVKIGGIFLSILFLMMLFLYSSKISLIIIFVLAAYFSLKQFFVNKSIIRDKK